MYCRIERLAKLFCSRKSRNNVREEQQICQRPWMDDWTAFFAMQSVRSTNCTDYKHLYAFFEGITLRLVNKDRQ